jgi:hypothetical protein
MIKTKIQAEPLDFDHLSREKQEEIEAIIETKIKERQQEDLERLMKEVTEELQKSSPKSI